MVDWEGIDGPTDFHELHPETSLSASADSGLDHVSRILANLTEAEAHKSIYTLLILGLMSRHIFACSSCYVQLNTLGIIYKLDRARHIYKSYKSNLRRLKGAEELG